MRAGRIKVSQEMLLNWLQFPRGEFIEVKLDPRTKDVEFVIEHYEMPEVKDHNIENVMPFYTQYTDCIGNSVVIREPLNK